MSFLYFAYGSNLWPPQMRSRCGSARVVGPAVLPGWVVVYDKPGADGSAKLNIREDDAAETHGVVYRIDDDQRALLDRAEPGYVPFTVTVKMRGSPAAEALTYRWVEQGTEEPPVDWYVAVATRGARHHGLPADYVSGSLDVEAAPDPIAPGVEPAGVDDLTTMQRVLSAGLTAGSDHHVIHPGELAWWMWHADPRQPDSLSFWLFGDDGVVLVDSRSAEIGVFAAPDSWIIPLVEWAQRRLGGAGTVGWVADSDAVLVGYLEDRGYGVADGDLVYEMDLDDVEIPRPALPDEWHLRSVGGEHEADSRSRAEHGAFCSSMDPLAHRGRYLRFMRSPVYEPDRDLVVAASDGRIACFMIWWPDPSGIAQIVPFGTHPEFRRMGLGTALARHGLTKMRDAGMSLARVRTDESRTDASRFYESLGFTAAGRVGWWTPGRGGRAG